MFQNYPESQKFLKRCLRLPCRFTWYISRIIKCMPCRKNTQAGLKMSTNNVISSLYFFFSGCSDKHNFCTGLYASSLSALNKIAAFRFSSSIIFAKEKFSNLLWEIAQSEEHGPNSLKCPIFSVPAFFLSQTGRN